MGIKWSSALIFIMSSFTVLAQSPAEFIEFGKAEQEKGKYNEAFAFYAKAYEMDSSSFNATVAYADGARLVKEYTLAERLYAKAYEKDEGKLFPEGAFYLGLMERYNGKYEEALRHYKKYLKKNKKKGNYFHDKAVAEVEGCNWSINYEMTSDSLSLKRMSDMVNSSGADIAPLLHDSVFYFSREVMNGASTKWELFFGKWNTDSIESVASMSGEFDSRANLNFTNNGEVFYSTANILGIVTINKAMWENGEIQEAEQWSAMIQSRENGTVNTQPHWAKMNGFEYVFFSSNRTDGEGGMDIWWSRKEGDTWSLPVNAGPTINTPDDELSPFYLDGTLYFSSSWHPGLGGQDVFMSKGTPGAFTEPVNMGKPINSSYNDFYFSMDRPMGKLFVVSNRPQTESGATCCNDIWSADFSTPTEPEEVKSDIKTLADLNRILPVTLYFHNDEPNPNTRDTTTQLSYSDAYDSYFKLFNTYIKENTKGLSGDAEEEATFDVEDFFDLKVKKGKSDLDLFCSLLLIELQLGKHIQISVRGFASPRAESDYNENLTKRRIQSLVNEMKRREKGAFAPFIESGQLSFNAIPFGEYKADVKVSDDLNNEKQSIYSRGARLERKIEIESVELKVPPVKKAEFKMDTMEHDFGLIPKYEKVYHTFYIENTGNAEMVIDSVVAECGCTTPELPKTVIAPGEKVAMPVGFDPFGKKGKDEKTVTIYIQGEEPRILTIRAEIDSGKKK